ncbi:MAG: type II toxin-antitoxin system VapC family toxin [Aeromicrobium sp.]
MVIVTDSSVIVAICLAGGDIGRLWGHELRGPAHLAAEVTSTIREQVYRNEVTNEVGTDALRHLAGLAISYEPAGRMAEAAYELATQNGWAKTYDAEYVALARALDCPLVTLDRRLGRGAAHLATILALSELPEIT